MLFWSKLSSLKKNIDLRVSLNRAGENMFGWLALQQECLFVWERFLERQRLRDDLAKGCEGLGNGEWPLSSLSALLPTLRIQMYSKARASVRCMRMRGMKKNEDGVLSVMKRYTRLFWSLLRNVARGRWWVALSVALWRAWRNE